MVDFFCTECGLIEAMDEHAPICWVCGSDEGLVLSEAWCRWVTPA